MRLHAQQEKEVEDARSKLIELKGEVEELLREKALLKHKPPVKTMRDNFHPSRAVSSEWKKQLLKAKRLCGNCGVVEEIYERAREGQRKKERGDAGWNCLLEKDSPERMYTNLSVCDAAHPDFVESLILGTTAWKASMNKEFERALGNFQSAQTMGMGVHYSTQVTTGGGEGLSYAQLEEVIDKMRIYLDMVMEQSLRR